MNTSAILQVADIYAAYRGLRRSTISTYAANDGKLLDRLEAGSSCTIRRANQLLGWARKVVREWHAAGLIAAALQDGQTTIWRAVVEPDPPSETAYARESRRPEFAMWRTMRDLRRFKAEDVLLTANTDSNPLTLPDVQKYCSTLAEAGFLKVAIKARVGRSAVYTMVGRPPT